MLIIGTSFQKRQTFFIASEIILAQYFAFVRTGLYQLQKNPISIFSDQNVSIVERRKYDNYIMNYGNQF